LGSRLVKAAPTNQRYRGDARVLPKYYDAKAGKLFLEVSCWNNDFLYANSLPVGVGSNDIDLDRGQIGGSLIVHFERSGPKVLLVALNQEYRALTESEP
jgi:hypothetical protein